MRKYSRRVAKVVGSCCALALWTSMAASATDRAPILPSVKSRSATFDDSRPPGVPDDLTLEASGARIGSVGFKALQLFDIGGRDQDSAIFRVGNRLHIRT